MTEPPPKISKRRANMIWPVRASILSLQPWKHILQFVDVRRESEAVSQIYTAIAKGEKFCAEQILSAETTEMNGRAGKNSLETLLPSWQKVTRKRTRSICSGSCLEACLPWPGPQWQSNARPWQSRSEFPDAECRNPSSSGTQRLAN